MNKEVFVFEVSQKSFADSVLQNSHKIPVIVEFMAVWSAPCIVMSDLFSALAREFAEEFIFAKVDIEEQDGLRQQYKIDNVPALVIFKDGKAIRNETGQLTEPEARTLLKDLGVFHKADLICEQAREKHIAGDTSAAILLLTEAIQSEPGNTSIALHMVQIMLDINEIEQANSLFQKLPEKARQSELGKTLNGQLTFSLLAAKTPAVNELNQRLLTDEHDYDARFDLAINLVASYQYTDAIEQLLKIIKSKPDFKDGAAKEMIITITNMIAPLDNDLAQDFRRKLSNILTG